MAESIAMTKTTAPAGMPAAIRLFLGYALVILALIGLSLRFVVDQAISAPVSGIGVVVMALLAYTIFTTTLVFQRKEASLNLALGLASLTIPAVPLALFTFALSPLGAILAVLLILLSIALFRGLTRPSARAWLNEP
jgi:predicted lysophospholipase L1 biosynthesis ABC-type transport system permease subunit